MKKTLSIIIAFVMLFSVMTVTSFADSTQHTITLEADTTTVKPGDTFSVSAILDTSKGINAITLKIAVPTAFVVDRDISEDIMADYEISMPNCFDLDWAYEHLELGSTKKWGDPVCGTVDGDGFIGVVYAAAKSSGISDRNAIADMELSKINLTVAEDAAPGTYDIYLYESESADAGESFGAPFACTPLTITVEGGEVAPTVPTAADLGLFTDANQNFKVTDKVMTSNGYSIEKALGFVSGINADAAVVKYGTEITCEGFDKVLDIPAANSYEASETVKGFVAAVTSIRKENLTKTFTAKAYADVTVGEETVRIYATDAATAVYGN